MSYSEETTIAGPSRGSADAWFEWASGRGASRPDDVRQYLDTVYEFAPKAGLRAELIVTQSIHETSMNGVPWASHWWKTRCNPAGIGITGDPNQNNASRNFENGRNAALAHIVHVFLYVKGKDLPAGLSPSMDPRWENAASVASIVGKKLTLRSFGNAGESPTWAVDPEYGKKWAGWANRLEDVIAKGGDVVESGSDIGSAVDARPTVRPYIVIVSGHRSEGDPGNPAERELTDDLAEAYTRKLRAAGYTADWFQRDLDMDDLPTSTRKGSHKSGLDAVALGCARVLANRPEPMSIMLDLHFDGTGLTQPCHAVVPDVGNLVTAYRDGAPRDDTAANNPRDVKLAHMITTRIVENNPGMRLYRGGRLGVDGCFSERDSGVAGQFNARLAMFAATARVRGKAVRLVVEHGGTEAARLPDFFNRCADAAVSAIKEMFPLEGTVVIEPSPSTELPPENLELIVAEKLFGSVTAGGTTYTFNPNGPVSQQWLAEGRESGEYPRLIEVLLLGSRKYFQFSNGMVLWQPSQSEALRQLEDLDV